jgi:hypothetical protein
MYKKMLSPALLLAILFSISVGYCGEFSTLVHDASSSLDSTISWVHESANTPFAIKFTSDASSLNNVTQINFWTTGSGITLVNVSCPQGWSHTGFTSKSIECQANTSVLGPGESAYVNATIVSTHVTSNAITVWNWFTTDDNSSYADSGNFSIGIDVKGPVINVTMPSEGSLQNNSISVNITIVENEVMIDVSTYNYTVSGNCSAMPQTPGDFVCDAQNKTCYKSYTIDSTSLDFGSCSISVSVRDTFGNLGTYMRNFTFRNDYDAPSVTIHSPVSGWYSNSVFVNTTINDNYWVNNAKVRWENGTNGTWMNLTKTGGYYTFNYNTATLAEGNYTFRIQATDRVGNVDESQTVDNIGIDHTAPTITITSPAVDSDIVVGSSVSITATILDTGSGVNENCSVDIGGVAVGTLTYAAGVCSGSVIVPSVGSGNQQLTVTISDATGNLGYGAINVVVRYAGGGHGGGGGGGSGGTSFNTTDNSLGLGENHRPMLTAPKIDNENPKYGDTITCLSGIYSDEDRDSKVADGWRWYANGEAVLGMTSQTLEITAAYKAGDKFYCMQRVTDGMSYSEWMKSSNEAVLNVEEQLSETPIVEPKTEITKPVSSGITGAFLGLGDDDLGFIGTVGLVSFFGLVLTISVLKTIGRRGKNFKIE